MGVHGREGQTWDRGAYMGHEGLYGTRGLKWDMGAYGIWRLCDMSSLDTGNDTQLDTSLPASARRSSAG
jgi:hypothetical protein